MEKTVRIIALIFIIFTLIYIISSLFILIIVYNFGRYIFDEKAAYYNSYEYNFFQRLILDNPLGLFRYAYKHFADDPYLEDIYHLFLLYVSIGIFISSVLILFKVPFADYLLLLSLSIKLPFSYYNFSIIYHNLFYKLKINLLRSTCFFELLFLIFDIAVIVFLLIYLTGKTLKFSKYILKKFLQSTLNKTMKKRLLEISLKILFPALLFTGYIAVFGSSLYIQSLCMKNNINFYDKLRLNITHYFLLKTNPPQKRVQYKIEWDPFILEIDYYKFMESFKNDFCKYKKEIKPGKIDMGFYFLIKDNFSNMSCINLDLIMENEKITDRNVKNDFYYYMCRLALKENALIYDLKNKRYIKYLKGHYHDDGLGGSTDYTYGKHFILTEGFWIR